ncbi:hypothetical protein BDZ97DRAFT_1790556 [Flammula alnicola]|nr:hypothetical protein BDZ97DRAFT_1790556 [Flammula alnicola]
MTSKSLSTSTLSLRFMQNAHRAKQLKEVELDRAEVQDDGKWEVSQVVRDSWGVEKDIKSESSDVHEESYLPFLFSGKDDMGSDVNGLDIPVRRATGRRVFNKKGDEVSLVPSAPDATAASTPRLPTPTPPSAGRKIHPRPISISASGTSGQLRGFEQLKKSKDSKNPKTAREAIFENGGVGVDLRSQNRKNVIHPPTTTFLKPVGVVDPKDIQTASSTIAMSNSEAIIDGARRKKAKTKRERETPANEPSETSETTRKPKKKKKNPE